MVQLTNATQLIILLVVHTMAAIEKESSESDRRKTGNFPLYMILVPTMVHPSIPLVVSVHLLRSPHEEKGSRVTPIKVTITLLRGDNQLEMITREILPASSKDIKVAVPDHLMEGVHPYSLRVEGIDYRRMEGSLFLHNVPIQIFKPKQIIIIQLNSHTFIPEQTVQVLISVRQTSLEPYTGLVHLNLLSPQGILVRRWTRQSRGHSPLVFQYQVAKHTALGEWTVRASTDSMDQTESFLVLDFSPSTVDISVDLPRRISLSDRLLSGTISANYSHSGLPVLGNLSLSATVMDREGGHVLSSLLISQPEWSHVNGRGTFVFTKEDVEEQRQLHNPNIEYSSEEDLGKEFYSLNDETSLNFFNGFWKFNFPLHQLIRKVKNKIGLKVKIVAKVWDQGSRESYEGFAEVLVDEPRVQLNFLGSGTQFIDAEMPFDTLVAAAMPDGSRLNALSLSSAKLEVWTTLVLYNRTEINIGGKEKTCEPLLSAWKHSSSLSSEVRKRPGLRVSNIRGIVLEARYQDDTFQGDTKVYLTVREMKHRISISCSTRNPQVGENIVFHVRSNKYVEYLNYVIINSGKVLDTNTVKMAPYNMRTFHLLVRKEMELVSTLLVWHVDSEGYVVAQSLPFPVGNEGENLATVHTWSPPDTQGSSQSLLEITTKPNPGNLLSISSLPQSLWKLQDHKNKPYRLSLYQAVNQQLPVFKWNGVNLENDIVYVFLTQSAGSSASQFARNHLTVLTDAVVDNEENVTDVTCPLGFKLCEMWGCLSEEVSCEERSNCHSWQGCEDKKDRRLDRNLISSMFPSQSKLQLSTVPRNMSILYKSHTADGSDQVITSTLYTDSYIARHYSQVRMENVLQLTVSGPKHCRVGEEISIEVNVKNNGDADISVDIFVPASDKYQLVLTHGEILDLDGKHLRIPINRSTWRTVLVPVRPYKLGLLDVSVSASDGVSLSHSMHTMKVRDTGFTQSHHTSTQLDLSHNSYSLQYFAVDTPGDNSLTFSITGDILGPFLPQELQPAVTCLDSVSGLARLVHHYKYSKHNQRKVEHSFSHLMNQAYQEILSCQLPGGGLAVTFNGRLNSIWVTAYAAKILDESLSEVALRFGLSVDLQVVESAVEWIITQQLDGGSFQENEMFPDASQAPVEFQEVSVTAQVVITLASLRNIRPELKRKLKQKSVLLKSSSWLSSQLKSLDRDPHPHDLAIVAYALHLSDHPSKEAAFQLLSKYRIESDQFMFWGSDTDPPHKTQLVDSQPHLLPNLVLCCQSLSVRATAYGLLTYTARREFIIEPIVQWINARRHSHSSWSSAVDSALATEALMVFSVSSPAVETSLSVNVEFVGNMKKKVTVLTVNDVEMGPHVIQLDNFYGHVRVEVTGQGRAVVQLSSNYKALTEASLSVSPVAAYEQEVEVQLMKNNSELVMTSCQRWLCPYQTGYSGPAQLEVTMPTGYIISTHNMESLYTNQLVAGVEHTEDKIIVHYEYMTASTICLTLPFSRKYKVANLYSSIMVRIHSSLSPEHFQQSLISLPQLAVSICKLCGSHLCQHCASIISTSDSVSSHVIFNVIIISNLLTLVINR